MKFVALWSSGCSCSLPDVAAHFHVGNSGAAAAAPRASRAGLPLCGSGPDNVWQAVVIVKLHSNYPTCCSHVRWLATHLSPRALTSFASLRKSKIYGLTSSIVAVIPDPRAARSLRFSPSERVD